MPNTKQRSKRVTLVTATGPVQPSGDEIAEARTSRVMSTMPAELRQDDSSWEQRVRERAFAIWLNTGRPEGKADANWHQAERELSSDTIDVVENAIAETPGDSVKAFGTRS